MTSAKQIFCDPARSTLRVVPLAILLLLLVRGAFAGGYDTGGPAHIGPRWSNDHHHTQGVVNGRDCVQLPPGFAADYVPGKDAWGQPVAPAEQPYRFSKGFPANVDLDVNIGQKTVAGKTVDMYAGHLAFDPLNNSLMLNGLPLTQDCAPSTK